jgi:hypothetical protein
MMRKAFVRLGSLRLSDKRTPGFRWDLRSRSGFEDVCEAFVEDDKF